MIFWQLSNKLSIFIDYSATGTGIQNSSKLQLIEEDGNDETWIEGVSVKMGKGKMRNSGIMSVLERGVLIPYSLCRVLRAFFTLSVVEVLVNMMWT